MNNIARDDTVGLVKGGGNVTIDPDGTLNAPASQVIPIATDTTTGVVKGGGDITIAIDGTMNYTLPVATTAVLGGVKASAQVPVAADGVMSIGVLPKLNVTSATAGQHNIQVAMYTSGTGHTDAPAIGSPDGYYVQVGGHEYGTNSTRGIGLGYINNPVTDHPPVSIMHIEKDSTGSCKGDMVFSARNTTGATDVPTERLRITAAGDILAATGYQPLNDTSLATKAYVLAQAAGAGRIEIDPTPGFGYGAGTYVFTKGNVDTQMSIVAGQDGELMHIANWSDNALALTFDNNAQLYTGGTRSTTGGLSGGGGSCTLAFKTDTWYQVA